MGFNETNAYVYVKLGGSFITYKEKPFSINYEALEKTIEILYNVRDKVKLILGNGGGSFAHTVVKAYKGKNPVLTLTMCQNSTRKLNTIIVNYLVSHGIQATSIQTSAVIIEENTTYRVFPDPISFALRNNIIPVLYGECIFSTNTIYKIVSTEEVFKILARHFKPQHIVLLTDVEGVYTCNPSTCSEAKLIRYIGNDNLEQVLETLESTSASDATGSIYGKVLLMSKLSRELNVKIYIVSGFNVEEAINAILGKEPNIGTVIDTR